MRFVRTLAGSAFTRGARRLRGPTSSYRSEVPVTAARQVWGAAIGVDIVEMRSGLDQPEHVVDGEYVVAVTAPGAVEFEPFLVGAEMGHNDIPVELGIVPGDVPTSNRPARGPSCEDFASTHSGNSRM